MWSVNAVKLAIFTVLVNVGAEHAPGLEAGYFEFSRSSWK